MDGILPRISRPEKRRLKKRIRNIADGPMKTRYLIVINLAEGRGATDTASALNVSRSTVYRVAERYRESGESGLIDRREDNGSRKLNDDYLGQLLVLVAGTPQDYGWNRPTWTRELLMLTMARLTGIAIHVTTMSRALAMIRCRLGRPKPIVGCPWPEAAKSRRLNAIRRLIENLPDDEVVLYEDEVDIHLNPKIGPDWMVQGQQKEVMTPGQNEKRYLAGAIDAVTGELTWVESDKKTTLLFLQLLWELTQRYSSATTIHLILDNYCIHSTEQVRISLETAEGKRLSLHFLPPYCPDHNRIERLWRDLHANVTRNHTCDDMDSLMKEVRSWLRRRSKQNLRKYVTDSAPSLSTAI